MHVLVAGCGWLGTALAKVLVARGDRVTGVRRSAERAAGLAALGIEPLALDLSAPGASARLPRVDAIVACQSSGLDSPEAYRAAYLAANQTLLGAARVQRVQAFVYTGSTGVFGQRDGSDVDETTPAAPASATAHVLAEAERLVRQAPDTLGVPACLVRLSGLYGAGRTGLVDRLRGGALALGPGDDAFMNFCQLDDAIAFVLGALSRGEAGAVYHASDAFPPRRREVVTWLAGRLGMAPPRTQEPAPAGPNRRILSAWSRAQLGVGLLYPSFREGFIPLVGAASSMANPAEQRE